MALYPNSLTGQDRLQPGARGNLFSVDQPGYRGNGEADRVNRTNNKLNTNAHDVPNIKYEFDRRLPVLFKYGFAFGYNQIVIPKGRIVAADPFMDLYDFDMKKVHNTLTLANGGVPVRLRTSTDKYRDDSAELDALVSVDAQDEIACGEKLQWAPVAGLAETYTKNSFRPFFNADAAEGASNFIGPKAQLDAAGLTIDVGLGSKNTGKIVTKTTFAPTASPVRPGNLPLGILSRNEYTRDDDAYNGIMPGAVLTDAMVELPWFAYKDKAEMNPWGSAYGGLFAGALVKSDENGRFVVSPLSFPEDDMADMGNQELEMERQQVLGQVYSVDSNLVPEGAAKWATWALADRLNFNEFNPSTMPQNNRSGEDAIAHSAYKSSGEYPGYPYDNSIHANDLHMLASIRDNASNRMNQQYQYENLGIPGLTDGYNAAVTAYGPQTAGTFTTPADKVYTDMFFKTSEVNVQDIQISVAGSAFVAAVEGGAIGATGCTVKFADALQGIIVITVTNPSTLETLAGGANRPVDVKVKFNKRGKAGVPTFLDWDGVVGSVKVLLTK